MKQATLIFLSLAIALAASMSLDAKVKRTRGNTAAKLPANINELMQAPVIKTNAEGFYDINRDAPRSLQHLKVTVQEVNSEERFKLKIYLDGKLMQTLSSDATQNEVKFLDANFDGYVDIVFGATYPREYTDIFLWNPTSKKFVEALDEGSFNGLMVVNPSKKELYCYLSGGASFSGYSISRWNGIELKRTESLYEIDDISSWADEGYRKKYSVVNGNCGDGNIRPYLILETDDLSSVPSHWRSIMSNINACFEY